MATLRSDSRHKMKLRSRLSRNSSTHSLRPAGRLRKRMRQVSRRQPTKNEDTGEPDVTRDLEVTLVSKSKIHRYPSISIPDQDLGNSTSTMLGSDNNEFIDQSSAQSIIPDNNNTQLFKNASAIKDDLSGLLADREQGVEDVDFKRYGVSIIDNLKRDIDFLREVVQHYTAVTDEEQEVFSESEVILDIVDVLDKLSSQTLLDLEKLLVLLLTMLVCTREKILVGLTSEYEGGDLSGTQIEEVHEVLHACCQSIQEFASSDQQISQLLWKMFLEY